MERIPQTLEWIGSGLINRPVLRDTFEFGRQESKPLELNLTDMELEHSTVLTFVFEQIIDHGTIFELKICDNSTVDALGQVI